MVTQQRRVLLAALLDEAGHGRQFDAPHVVAPERSHLLLHADDKEARGPEHDQVQGGLAVVVVLLDE